MTKRHKIRSYWNHFRYYLSFPLVLFYVIVGGIFLFSNTWIDFVPKGRIAIGLGLVFFAILRFFVARKRHAKTVTKLQFVQNNTEKHEKDDKLGDF